MNTETAIKVLMAGAGLSKRSLACKAGISRPTLDKIMAGKGTVASALMVAAALGCTLDDLCLGGDDG